MSSTGPGNDSDFITPGNQAGQACSICKVVGHQRPTCHKFKEWRQPELDFGNDKTCSLRLQFSHNLRNGNTFIVEEVYPLDAASNPPRINTPIRGVKGIVIHKKLSNQETGSIFFQCTMLNTTGDPLPHWVDIRFTVDAVTQFINKSRSSIVINDMELRPDITEEIPLPGSHLLPLDVNKVYQQPLPQLSMISYTSLALTGESPMELMGYEATDNLYI
jgi:hypothetical protein